MINVIQKIVNSKFKKFTNLVHCSAGIGRTGTYIAIEVGRLAISQGKEFDLYKFVEEMRHQRAGMVNWS
jgi:protein tyrosine phosphatase